MSIKRGDIFYVDLNPAKGSEQSGRPACLEGYRIQSGRRPVLVIQNNIGNEVSPTVIVAPLTTKKFSKEYPTNVRVKKGIANLKEDSAVLLSQIRTIDKNRLERKVGNISGGLLRMVDEAIKISLGLL